MCVDFADHGTGFGINREPLFRLLITNPAKLIIKKRDENGSVLS